MTLSPMRAAVVIALVQRVQGVQKREAVAWLAEFAGVPLDTAPTLEQRRQYARATQAAEVEARDLVAYKQDMVNALRAERNELLHTYHAAKRFLFRYSEEACRRYGGLTRVPSLNARGRFSSPNMQRVDELQAHIDLIEGAQYADILPIFRTRMERQEAA